MAGTKTTTSGSAERNYWNQSKSPLYSFIFTLPLFLIYESGILLLNREHLPGLRNGADVLMRQVLTLFGNLGMYGFGVVFMIGFIVTFILQKQRWSITNVRSSYLLIMFGESLVWGFLLFFVLSRSQSLLLMSSGQRLIQQLVLAVGAGIYEEFVFRVILISGLAALLKLVFQWNRTVSSIVAVVLAAILFSWFHFMGGFGDAYDFRLLAIRILAGILLGVIYVLRGFGVVAYSHAWYDLIVLTMITTR